MAIDFSELGHPQPGSLSGGPGIGIVGSGWIVRECHLPAYAEAGANVVGLCSRSSERAAALAAEQGIRAFANWEEMVDDPAISVIDIAYPPDAQPDLIEAIAARDSGIRGILAQKPLAMDLDRAVEVVDACERAGVVLGVNQNMRYDHSIRALRLLLSEGCLGQPVIAQITMHARVGWMPYAGRYDRRAMLIMSVHHLDAFRFLFGEPASVSATTRPRPGDQADGADDMATYTLIYPDGLLAVGIDNTFSRLDQGIEWRVDGTEGTARGSVGWPDHPWGSASTLRLQRLDDPASIIEPTWTQRWFPHAFAATMAEVLEAIRISQPPTISGRDNLKTMAVLEAAYQSAEEGRRVATAEVASDPFAARAAVDGPAPPDIPT